MFGSAVSPKEKQLGEKQIMDPDFEKYGRHAVVHGANDAKQVAPRMEACGMDVYQTARNNGFSFKPLCEKTETQNEYCLVG